MPNARFQRTRPIRASIQSWTASGPHLGRNRRQSPATEVSYRKNILPGQHQFLAIAPGCQVGLNRAINPKVVSSISPGTHSFGGGDVTCAHPRLRAAKCLAELQFIAALDEERPPSVRG